MKLLNSEQIVIVIQKCIRMLLHNTANDADLRYSIFRQIEDLTDGREQIASEVLEHSDIKCQLKFLRQEYARTLFDLEQRWALTLLRQPTLELSSFPKYEQYKLRLDFEMHMIQVLYNFYPKRVLICGCGSLPVSAALIRKVYGLRVDILDRSNTAIRLAKQLLHAYNIKSGVSYIEMDVNEYHHYEKYCVVFLAGTVGVTSFEKSNIVKNIYNKLKPGSLIVVREPFNLDKLLIAETNISEIGCDKIVWAQIDSDADCIRRAFIRK